MTIELSKTEVELIDAALDVWEKQPHSEGMITSMLGIMTRRDEPSRWLASCLKAVADSHLWAWARCQPQMLMRGPLAHASRLLFSANDQPMREVAAAEVSPGESAAEMRLGLPQREPGLLPSIPTKISGRVSTLWPTLPWSVPGAPR
jgi:hypothetical protein